MRALETFRATHDPLAAALPAHVTFVFPFASSLSGLQVATHVRRVAGRWPPIPIRLSGVGCFHGEWVHLRVASGAESIVELHDRLYRRALASFLRADLPYGPHVTIGRAADLARSERILAAAKAAFAYPLDAILRSVVVLALPDERTVVREVEIPFG